MLDLGEASWPQTVMEASQTPSVGTGMTPCSLGSEDRILVEWQGKALGHQPSLRKW